MMSLATLMLHACTPTASRCISVDSTQVVYWAAVNANQAVVGWETPHALVGPDLVTSPAPGVESTSDMTMHDWGCVVLAGRHCLDQALDTTTPTGKPEVLGQGGMGLSFDQPRQCGGKGPGYSIPHLPHDSVSEPAQRSLDCTPAHAAPHMSSHHTEEVTLRKANGTTGMLATVRMEGGTSTTCEVYWAGGIPSLRYWRLGVYAALACAWGKSDDERASIPSRDALFRTEAYLTHFSAFSFAPDDRRESAQEKYIRLIAESERNGWWSRGHQCSDDQVPIGWHR